MMTQHCWHCRTADYLHSSLSCFFLFLREISTLIFSLVFFPTFWLIFMEFYAHLVAQCNTHNTHKLWKLSISKLRHVFISFLLEFIRRLLTRSIDMTCCFDSILSDRGGHRKSCANNSRFNSNFRTSSLYIYEFCVVKILFFFMQQ